MNIQDDGYWIRFSLDEYTGDSTGKYLFFSPDRELLQSIAKNELKNHNFKYAKMNAPDNRNNDHVLCLYWEDSSRKEELRERYLNTDVAYRGWKSNEATLKGMYSKKFKENHPEIAKKLLGPTGRET